MLSFSIYKCTLGNISFYPCAIFVLYLSFSSVFILSFCQLYIFVFLSHNVPKSLFTIIHVTKVTQSLSTETPNPFPNTAQNRQKNKLQFFVQKWSSIPAGHNGKNNKIKNAQTCMSVILIVGAVRWSVSCPSTRRLWIRIWSQDRSVQIFLFKSVSAPSTVVRVVALWFHKSWVWIHSSAIFQGGRYLRLTA